MGELCRPVYAVEVECLMLRGRGRGCGLGLDLNVEVVLGLALEEESGLDVGHRGGRGVVESESARGLVTVSKVWLGVLEMQTNRILAGDLWCPLCDGDRLACRLCP